VLKFQAISETHCVDTERVVLTSMKNSWNGPSPALMLRQSSLEQRAEDAGRRAECMHSVCSATHLATQASGQRVITTVSPARPSTSTLALNQFLHAPTNAMRLRLTSHLFDKTPLVVGTFRLTVVVAVMAPPSSTSL